MNTNTDKPEGLVTTVTEKLRDRWDPADMLERLSLTDYLRWFK